MALHVTQCPRCESTFNTSARMLQAAHGLVRCGACLSIFEADQHFVDLHSSASNDEREQPNGASVFISAPEDYFNPGAFLKKGDRSRQADQEPDWEEEVLYAKSDETDSDFDVFDVDPVEDDALAKEQLTDSNFDVFSAGDPDEAATAAHLEVQDHEFDIYDAGVREIRQPVFVPVDEPADRPGQDEFDVRASFNFAAGPGPADFTAQILPGILTLGRADRAGAARQKSRTDSQTQVLPPQRGATTRSAAPADDRAGEVILPPGPDAATLLAARKKANEQSRNHAGETPIETESGAEFLYDDDHDFEPAESRFLDAVMDASEAPRDDQSLNELAFAEAFTADTEWEEADADIDVDEKSFVILPVDPYQPSAFLSQNEAMTDQSQPKDKQSIPAGAANRPVQRVAHQTLSADGPANSSQERPFAGRQRPGGAGRSARESDDQAAEVRALSSQTRQAAQESEERDNAGRYSPKEALRARVVATRLDAQDDPLEQLSEENLRAVRDVDTALELEQRDQRKRSSRIALIALACVLLTLVLAGQFFWQRMPVLSQDQRFRPWYQSACEVLGCQLPPYVNPALIQTDNLVVRSHPQLENTLELTAVFRNRAAFPQPFPLIELRFSDLNAMTVASREMTPDEYLPPALRGLPLMPAGAPVQISLELADPGPSAVNYQLSFSAAPPRPGY